MASAIVSLLPLIAPLITVAAPAIEEIFKSIFGGIAEINASKVGAKLTPDQAAAANASATKIAQTSLAAKVSTGKLLQADVDKAIPDAATLSKMIQGVYDAGPAIPTTSAPITTLADFLQTYEKFSTVLKTAK